MIWKQKPDIESLNNLCKKTLVEHLGIEFVEIGDDFLKARMPVDHRTVQPMGILHGGASVAIAESVGSVASTLCIDLNKQSAVGAQINANHLRAAKEGFVTAIVHPVKIGRKLHVWDIKIHDDKEKLVCVSRLTMAVIDR